MKILFTWDYNDVIIYPIFLSETNFFRPQLAKETKNIPKNFGNHLRNFIRINFNSQCIIVEEMDPKIHEIEAIKTFLGKKSGF